MILAADVIERYREYSIKEGLREIPPGAIVNNVDPVTFNYSLEEPILREFGSFFNITHPYSFSTIQPCIRTGDFAAIKRGTLDDHVSQFTVLPVDFQLHPNMDEWEKLHLKAVQRLTHLIFSVFRLDPLKTHAICFGGGSPNEICSSLRKPYKSLPPDDVARGVFLAAGVPPENITMPFSQDTFLLTFPGNQDFYSGYRYEIFYQVGNRLVEIGTGEALFLKQIRENSMVVELQPLNAAIVVCVVGLERMLVALNEFDSVFDCDHIAALWQGKHVDIQAMQEALIRMADNIRAIHLIWGQTDGGASLIRTLRDRLRSFVAFFLDLCLQTKTTDEQIMHLFDLNAHLQPWQNGLAESATKAALAMIEKLNRRRAKRG